MTIFLNEDWFGIDNDIVFPNVQTCVALIVESFDGRLGGLHATLHTSSMLIKEVCPRLVHLLGATRRIVCIGHLGAFQNNRTHLDMVYPNALRATLQQALGLNGPVLCFDSSGYVSQLANGGATVRAMRDGAEVRYFVGSSAALGDPVDGLCGNVVFRASEPGGGHVRIRSLQNTQRATYPNLNAGALLRTPVHLLPAM